MKNRLSLFTLIKNVRIMSSKISLNGKSRETKCFSKVEMFNKKQTHKTIQCVSKTKRGTRCRRRVTVSDKIEISTPLCHIHSLSENKFNLEKPNECPVCYESLDNVEKPIICGHWLHESCITRHFRSECPVCRCPLDIEVFGSPPTPLSDIPDEFSEDEFYAGDTEDSDDLSDFVYDNEELTTMTNYIIAMAQLTRRRT